MKEKKIENNNQSEKEIEKYPLNWNFDLIFKNKMDKESFEKLKNNTNPKEKEKIIEDFLKKDIEESIKKTNIITEKYQNNKEYLKDPLKLKEALDEFEQYSKNGIIGISEYYYWLNQQLDLNDKSIIAKLNQLEQISTPLSNKLIFFTNELSKVPKEIQDIFLKSEDLKIYHRYLEKMFENAKYELSEKEEIIVHTLSKTSYSNWTEMTERFLSQKEARIKEKDGKEVILNWSSLMMYLYKEDDYLRNQAIDEIKRILKELNEISEIEMNSLLEHKRNMMQLRGFEYFEQSRHLSDDIETEVVNTMVENVVENYDVSKEFYEFKAKLLKKSSFRYFDKTIKIDINKNKVEEKWTYEKSIDLIKEVFESLDEEFLEIFNYFVKDGHIDVYPKKGKSDGAFCISVGVEEPTYILLNHTDSLRDVTTIAHECGHGINNELMKRHQISHNYGSPLSTAEVASTFMEDFVFEQLLKTTTKENRLNLLLNKLDDDIATIFRQVACYNFERELHKDAKEKGYLSKEEISQLFNKNMKAYLGPLFENADDMDDGWVYWSHIRRPFYVYSYASGLIISKAMQQKVKEDHDFIKSVKKFLSNGTEKSPKDIFNEIGIDITQKDFWQKGIQNVKTTLKQAKDLAIELNLI
ncbi:MAG: M3 family oligoendopeptidase [Candidatus Nanoarchaeia archaeon]|nr:M3 family oligoendopeptidase [Candidatus Nanoarchaeia archaeon]